MNASRIPNLIVRHWYECGRKIPLSSEVVASLYAETRRYQPLSRYPCPHGRHWHIGKPQTSTRSDRKHLRMQAARREWNRRFDRSA